MEQHAQNGYSMDAVADGPRSEACHDMVVYDADGEHRPHTACGTGIVATLLSMISARGRTPIDYGIVRQRQTETKEGWTSGRWQAKKDDAGSPASPHMTLSSSSAEQPRFNVEPPRAQPSPCLLLASCRSAGVQQRALVRRDRCNQGQKRAALPIVARRVSLSSPQRGKSLVRGEQVSAHCPPLSPAHAGGLRFIPIYIYALLSFAGNIYVLIEFFRLHVYSPSPLLDSFCIFELMRDKPPIEQCPTLLVRVAPDPYADRAENHALLLLHSSRLRLTNLCLRSSLRPCPQHCQEDPADGLRAAAARRAAETLWTVQTEHG